MFGNPFRHLRVSDILSPQKLIGESVKVAEKWLFSISRWRDRAIRIKNVQDHENAIYALQKHLNNSDYKLGKARQHRERYNTKKKELESLSNRFASGQLNSMETAFMLKLQTEFTSEFKDYDPVSENLHDELSVSSVRTCSCT